MPRTITWLHLSDLHACRPNSGWDAKRVLDALIADLKRMNREQQLQPDLIFFTGDAAFGHLGNESGKAISDQFREAHDFLTAVRKSFPQEIPQRNVFLVPGNHDVNRARITRFQTEWLEQDPPRPEKERKRTLIEIEQLIRDAGAEWHQLLDRLHDYRHALETYGYDHLLTGRERLIYADMREVSGVKIGIGGFNSSWSSRGTGRDEIANLWMGGRFQLNTILGKLPPHDLRLALIHHPGNWLVPEENQNPKFFDELQRDFHFVLHGHEHQQFVRQDASNGHAVFSAGACHEWSTGKNNGYSFVRLDLDSARGEAWLREYESNGAGWRPRAITGKTNDHGLWPLKLETLLEQLQVTKTPVADAKPVVVQSANPSGDSPSPSVVPTTPEADYEARYRKAVVDRLDYMMLFGIDVPRDSKEYSLSVAFVSVSLSDELIENEDDELSNDDAPRNSDDSNGDLGRRGREIDNGSLPVEEFFNKLSSDCPRLLIRGVAGCGKTTLLRWAAVQAGKSDSNHDWRSRVPFIIRLRDYAHGQLPRPQDYPLLLAKELPDAPAGWVEKLLDSGRALVMFDGVDEVPEPRRTQVTADIRQMIATYGKTAFVVTTRPEAVEREEFEALGFLSARVEDLSPSDRNELIDRWHDAMEIRLRNRNEATDLRPLRDRLKRRLDDNPAIARLTINPLLCAVVCALHREREENLPETPVSLCEKLTEMLLDRRDRERPGMELERAEDADYRQLDYAHRKGLVARLAYHMVLNGESAVSEDDAIAQLREGLASYQLHSLRPERILQLLIERSGVLQESSEQKIEFLHNTLKEFLAAERFANGGGVQVLADHSHEESWQPVILFAVALPRDGSDFATRLVRAIRDKTPLNTPPKSRKRAEKAKFTNARARQFFFFRCVMTAHQIDDAEVQAQFRTLASELLPPRTLTDANALATCGEAVVPYLAYRADWTAAQRAASVRALATIGGPRAIRLLNEHGVDSSEAVTNEMTRICKSLPSYLPALSGAMRHVRHLSFAGWLIRDISPLAGLTSLQSLDLQYTHVSDISPLARITSLESLRLHNTQVSDISPLAGLTSLQFLYLSNTQVSDLSPLAGLTSLQSLYLGSTQVSDLSPLVGLTSLQTLTLERAPVSDLSHLAGLASLQSLNLDRTLVSDLSPLATLASLQMLNLRNTQVSDLSQLTGLASLQALYLDRTLVSDLSPLATLTRLQRLDLDDTRVSDVSPLAGLTSLQTLYLVNLRVGNLYALEPLLGRGLTIYGK